MVESNADFTVIRKRKITFRNVNWHSVMGSTDKKLVLKFVVVQKIDLEHILLKK